MELAAEIVAAYVANNSLPVAELPSLIASVDAALRGLSNGAVVAQPAEKPTPAVPVRKSITPDYLICLDNGKKFQSLKRHLAKLGMTPDEYRAKWGLAPDYPMVAPNYAARRSELAKSMGLGQTRQKEAPPPPPAKRGKGKSAPAGE
jgi:predicted transcriptional regulator